MAVHGFWTNAFRVGLYDALMPVNYDWSLKDAWAAMAAQPKEQILDAGCGSGRLLVHARGWLTSGGRLTAVDIDGAGLAYAQRRARKSRVEKQVVFRSGDLCQLGEMGLPPLDGALAHFSLYTLPTMVDRRLALQQIVQALRPGGRCVLVVPSEAYRAETIIQDAYKTERTRRDSPWLARVLRRCLLYHITNIGLRRIEKALDQELFHRYTVEELETQCREAGLTDVVVTPVYAGCGYRVLGRRANR
jgi:ubiquinone/menaquinone biosynthesis C-methylase UbiE